MATIATAARALLATADLTRDQLLRVAVARGSRHYAPLLSPNVTPSDNPIRAALGKATPFVARFKRTVRTPIQLHHYRPGSAREAASASKKKRPE